MSRWVTSRPEYYVQTGGMHENPFGVPKDEILRMLLENPPEISAQVIFGKYVESSGAVFTSELIQKLFDRTLPIVRGNYYANRESVERAKAIVKRLESWSSPFHTGVDLARQTDWTVITTLDTTYTPARVVYWKRLQRVPWETIYSEIGRARAIFGPNILVDSTGMGGDVVMSELENRNYCAKHHETVKLGSRCMRDGIARDCNPEEYLPLACADGYPFSGSTKKELIELTRNALAVGYSADDPGREYGLVRSPPIVQLEEELAFYFWDDKKLVTDCLFSFALACWSAFEEMLDDPSFDSPFGS